MAFERVEIGPHVLYRGDCLEVLPTLKGESIDAIVTDPVWPGSRVQFAGSDDSHGLLRKSLELIQADRVVIHLCRDTDPRFLSSVPDRWPFLCVCWLRFARASYKGRLLSSAEVGYIFGAHPQASTYRVAPAEMVLTRSDSGTLRHTGRGDKTIDYEGRHPCPRQTGMVAWLVRWFGGPICCDPFMGSGTAGVACERLGRKFIGIEIEQKYFDIACRRIAAEVAQGKLAFQTEAKA
ncbi:MAG: DNA methyltransferase [Pseudomonadota bacterium]